MFSKKVNIGILLMLAGTLALAGCATPTEDPAVKITQIAMTVQAEITQNSLLTPSATATFTPTVTATPMPPTPTANSTAQTATPTSTKPVSPGFTGENATYIADVTIPDGTIVAAGSTFVKTWTIKNTGKTTWTKDYQLIYLEGVMGTNDLKAVKLTDAVAPGGTVDISVEFTAPQTNGPYVSYWKMFNSAGYVFGDAINVKFVVGIPSTTATAPTPETTPVTPTP